MHKLIGIDWGTSSLRAMLFGEDGTIREERIRPWGIRNLPSGGFDAALAEICTDWPSCPVLASGMVGSRQGWREVDYVDTPAEIDKLADGTVTLHAAGDREVSIIPGVRYPAGPDVMRGEETQIAGALASCPELAAESQFVLPGTHSKWVDVNTRKIVGFATMITGEMYALLCHHSLLGAVAPATTSIRTDMDPQAFDEGVRTAKASGNAGVLSRIFSARALFLESRLEAAAISGYLSGLLIGEEWRAMLASGWLRVDRAPTLVGDEWLCGLYLRAAQAFDLPQPASISGATGKGLWEIHLALHGKHVDMGHAREEECC